MEILIEKAVLADLDAVIELERELGLSSWSKTDYLIELSNPDAVFLVIKQNHKVIGFLLARLIMNSTYSFCEIYNIGISIDFKRKGLGSRLLATLLKRDERNADQNLKEIHLEVRKSNQSAINFYKKHNFKEIGTRKNFYRDPSEDALLMSLDLANQNKTST